MGTTGQTLTDVLERAWKGGFRTKSDFAREYADLVAMASVEGLITTAIGPSVYGKVWHITPAGARRLWIHKDMSA